MSKKENFRDLINKNHKRNRPGQADKNKLISSLAGSAEESKIELMKDTALNMGNEGLHWSVTMSVEWPKWQLPGGIPCLIPVVTFRLHK